MHLFGGQFKLLTGFDYFEQNRRSEARAVYLESGTEFDNLHDGNHSRQAFFQVE
jgi:hypothetical protein